MRVRSSNAAVMQRLSSRHAAAMQRPSIPLHQPLPITVLGLRAYPPRRRRALGSRPGRESGRIRSAISAGFGENHYRLTPSPIAPHHSSLLFVTSGGFRRFRRDEGSRVLTAPCVAGEFELKALDDSTCSASAVLNQRYENDGREEVTTPASSRTGDRGLGSFATMGERVARAKWRTSFHGQELDSRRRRRLRASGRDDQRYVPRPRHSAVCVQTLGWGDHEPRVALQIDPPRDGPRLRGQGDGVCADGWKQSQHHRQGEEQRHRERWCAPSRGARVHCIERDRGVR